MVGKYDLEYYSTTTTTTGAAVGLVLFFSFLFFALWRSGPYWTVQDSLL